MNTMILADDSLIHHQKINLMEVIDHISKGEVVPMIHLNDLNAIVEILDGQRPEALGQRPEANGYNQIAAIISNVYLTEPYPDSINHYETENSDHVDATTDHIYKHRRPEYAHADCQHIMDCIHDLTVDAISHGRELKEE